MTRTITICVYIIENFYKSYANFILYRVFTSAAYLPKVLIIIGSGTVIFSECEVDWFVYTASVSKYVYSTQPSGCFYCGIDNGNAILYAWRVRICIFYSRKCLLTSRITVQYCKNPSQILKN